MPSPANRSSSMILSRNLLMRAHRSSSDTAASSLISAGEDHVDQREREHPLPAQVHELIEAVAREGAAEPDVDEQEDDHLERQNQITPRHHVEERRARSTFGNGRSQPPRNRMVATAEITIMLRVLAQEEEGEAHAAVLGVEAGHQLARPRAGRTGCGWSRPRRPPGR